jgi:hypothetical protein
MTLTLIQLREFEDSCLKPRVTGQVIVRGDKENPTNKPAPTWLETQSYYYMPLITEAYYRAQGKDVPQIILNMSGRITLLTSKPDSIIKIEPKYYTNEGYEEFVQKIIAYLLKDGNLEKLKGYYREDNEPKGNSVGHINGESQVEILEGAHIAFTVELMIRIHFCKFI